MTGFVRGVALTMALVWLSAESAAAEPQGWAIIDAAVLRDKIHGGLVGQMLGNLNGLVHEMKYIAEPGSLATYTPALPDGARTDDDTDLEWVYTFEMDRSGELLLPPTRIAELWRRSINRQIWCANRYARDLMDLGLVPPLTGRAALNPWSDFNISGQFVCETFGLIAPAMPRTAATLGLHYTHVTIEGEPAQTTQLFTTMVATAFIEASVEKILAAGIAAIDPKSKVYEVVAFTREAWRSAPDDWQKARRRIRDQYTKHSGGMRDRNGYELNTAATVAALLYGKGDFAETLRLAFVFGWDADNNAATCGTILGVVNGKKWMDRQGWAIRDRYRNQSRDQMPAEEPISAFADRLFRLAERTIVQQGGRVEADGKRFAIRTQAPALLEPLLSSSPVSLRETLARSIEHELSGSEQVRARAAYLAVCLDLAPELRRRRPEDWQAAARSLKTVAPALLKNLATTPTPLGAELRERARAAGLD